MTPRRKSLLTPTKAAPSAEEVAARPDVVKLLLEEAAKKVYDLDIEHAVLMGITTTGAPVLFHTYGQDLTMAEVARLFTDVAAMARKQARKK